MFDHVEYISYHKALAESHVSLLHSDSVPSFVGTNHDEFNTLFSKKKIGDNVMHMLALQGRLTEDGAENVSDIVDGGFVIVSKIENPNKFQSEADAFSRAKEIGLDIIMKLRYDSQNNCPRLLQHFDFNKVVYRMAGPYHARYVGYAFEYPLIKQESCEYNPDKWQ